MDVNDKQFQWVEKYRPHKVADCILPKDIKSAFQEYVDKRLIPNLILHGTAGIGKTSIAKAMCEEIGADHMVLNGSDEGRLIDTFRTQVKTYGSSVSFSGGRKYIIIDEADYTNAESVQPALRNAMEAFAINCGFILTCNYPSKIIPAIHSRCSVVNFKVENGQRPKLASEFFKRVQKILENEKIETDEKVLVEVIQKHFPDFRRTLNELQSYAKSGKIDVGILARLSDISIKELVGYLKDKNFKEMRKWVTQNADQDTARVLRKLYDSLYEYWAPQSIPSAVLTISEYSYRSSFVMDQEINMVACLTTIMAESTFK